MGGALRRHRRPLRRAGDQAPRRLLPVAHRRCPTPTGPGFHSTARRRGRAGRGGAGAGAALRRLLLGRPGLDVQRPAHRRLQRPAGGPAPGRLRRLRRGPRARAHRPLPAQRAVERHLVAGRPAAAGRAAAASTTRRCPTGWSTTGSCRGHRCGRRPRPGRPAGCSTGRRPASAAGRHGHRARPSRPCSTCARPSTPCSTRCSPRPWECVRGIDRSFGHNRGVERGVLPGPRRAGVVAHRHHRQGRQPAAQRRARAARTPPSPSPSCAGSTGWPRSPARWARRCSPPARGCTPGRRRPVAGVDVRYTARDTTVFALVRGDGAAEVTLAEVRATPDHHRAPGRGRPAALAALEPRPGACASSWTSPRAGGARGAGPRPRRRRADDA